jgi:uncharacterized protein (TIGR00730 family)
MLLVRNNFKLVYGAGRRGLMGALANAVLSANGKVTGVIPQFMIEQGWHNPDLTELLITDSMHERKQTMATLADAVVALPGGCGTLEELLEIITWKQLGLFTKPVIILNINHYYDDLLNLLNKAAQQQFIRPEHLTMWQVCGDTDEVFATISSSKRWDRSFSKFAAV